MKLDILYIGKPKDEHANAIAADFLGRCKYYVRTGMREIRPEKFDPWQHYPAASKIGLDPAGKPMDSAAFTKLIAKATEEARDLVFLVGGADGLPDAWRGRADLLVSLSPMTFPHELARAMLAEQIYRAFATLRGLPYPR